MIFPRLFFGSWCNQMLCVDIILQFRVHAVTSAAVHITIDTYWPSFHCYYFYNLPDEKVILWAFIQIETKCRQC